MKSILKVAIALVLTTGAAQAQGINIGAKGSLNLTNIPKFTVIESLGQDLKYMATGGGALFAEIPLDANFSFRPEIAYNRRGGKLEGLNLGSGTIGQIIGNLANARLNLDYIDIPLLFKYNISTEGEGSPYVVAGPSLGFMVGHTMSNSILGLIDLNYNVNMNFKNFDLGGVVGLGYEMPLNGKMKGFVEATYRQGFLNAVDNFGPVKVDSKTSNFGISAGVSFPVGK
ncbi:hypothetical protein Lbys_2284 [Leadbetterella byssophila DSM 17132]|uniref:Outer membrane protein beta-barrel domain-containing protein n=1 Tax=Leadbetterella byssophila (strain DSM 17132 / JCM 16389 / KACC 11308 / NBRC 106382 / 4M15) TaxID=649349 RepID=E4RVR3_LEAB4|nr:porin family protein [Leadbetterella byssophila]ADQ17961.1 hypothetical protein Lbys_2284 [Leadbetterella byssophila DSM 17132]